MRIYLVIQEFGCNSRTKSDHSDRPQEVREVGFDDSTDSAYNDTVINSFANLKLIP